MLASTATAIALGRVVDHHHGGIHASQRVHAALTRRVKPRGAQIQLVVARNLDEGAPAEGSFEAGTKPVAMERGRGQDTSFLGFFLIKKFPLFFFFFLVVYT